MGALVGLVQRYWPGASLAALSLLSVLAVKGCGDAVRDLAQARVQRAVVAESNATLQLALTHKDEELSSAKASLRKRSGGALTKKVYDEKGTLRSEETAEYEELIQALSEQLEQAKQTPVVPVVQPQVSGLVSAPRNAPWGAYGALSTRLGYGGGLTYECLSLGSVRGSLGLGAMLEEGRLTGQGLLLLRMSR